MEYDLFPLPKNWVITPHAGELSKVLGISPQEINENRFKAVLDAAQMCGCHVLLKGYRTVMSYEDRTMIINSGNSALSKAGTGDVLTGLIAGLLAQGLETLQATATAAYIHGRIADEWVSVGKDKRTLMASDIKDHLPNLISRLSDGVLF